MPGALQDLWKWRPDTTAPGKEKLRGGGVITNTNKCYYYITSEGRIILVRL